MHLINKTLAVLGATSVAVAAVALLAGFVAGVSQREKEDRRSFPPSRRR